MNNTVQQDQEFQALIDFIKRSRGFDFTGYKSASLMRRISKRVETVGLQNFSDYMDYLEVHPEEFSSLFNTILINVTDFFRDGEAWNYVVAEVIPKILAEKPQNQPLRIWSAGCASGQEAYTLAMVLAEALGEEQFQQRVKIYATDVDGEDLSHARQGVYNTKELESIPTGLRGKYFELAGTRCTFRAEPRRAVIFGRHDLIQDAPIPRLDLLVCRNTLMYFNAETQNRVLARFHFALNDNGFLFLGKAEMLLTHASLFTPVSLKCRIFSKLPQPGSRNHLPALVQPENGEAATNISTSARYGRLRDAALDVMPVAQVVLDLQDTLVLANEHARRFFALSAKDLGRPFRDLEISYRPVELRSVLDEVITTRRPTTLREVEWAVPGKETRYLNVEITSLLDNGLSLMGVSICFVDVTRHARLRQELQRTNQELETAYEELQSTNEELETTNEELQSSVEELETTNEELQSSNEEMETMNEELQSTNEELETTNTELRHLTDELNRAHAFLGSILASLRTGVVVVDRNLNVLIWNHRAEDLWGLRVDEVQGQSFLNLDTGLPVQSLKDCIRGILNQQSEYEEVLLHATNRRGKAIQCRVICTPLRNTNTHGGVQGGIMLMEEREKE